MTTQTWGNPLYSYDGGRQKLIKPLVTEDDIMKCKLLGTMLLCSAMLFGCGNSVESQIQKAKDNSYYITTQEERDADESNFYTIVNDFQDGSLLSAKVTGFSYEDRIIVLEDSDCHFLDTGDEAYEHMIKVSSNGYSEKALWEFYPSILDNFYYDLKDITIYVEMLDANGDIVARVTYLNGDSSIERVG